MGTETESVYICLYSHKYGTDACAYRTREGALKSAWQLANERVDEDWEDEEKTKKFKGIDDAFDALAYFHDVEADSWSGESIEIIEAPLCE